MDKGEFIVLCGLSGSGKSTLLERMKSPAEAGKTSGEISFYGSFAGYVSQFPDEQIVCDKVWHELAFGAESIGASQSEIRSRVAQTALFFGIEELLYCDCDKLSGGQKQMINLASVMAMKPDVLLLDEPLSQLDPIASAQFVSLIIRINKELGTTIIVAEHRLDGLLSAAKRVILLDNGRVCCDGNTEALIKHLSDTSHPMLAEMPTGVRVTASVGKALPLLDVPSARDWYASYDEEHGLVTPALTESSAESDNCITIKNLSFGYKNSDRDTVRNLSLDIKRGSVTAVMGGNGAGKSTLLNLICGTLKPSAGRISINGGRLGFLPQDPTLLFSKETLREELGDNADKTAEEFGLSHLLSRHPFDLSGGERQKAAIAKLVSYGADILLLDEPTKGADAEYKHKFSAMLDKIKQSGKTVILVSHDMDFCAETADVCALLFDGQISVCLPPAEFFAASEFFTTDSAKIAAGVCENVYTADRLISSVGGKAETYNDQKDNFTDGTHEKKSADINQKRHKEKHKKLSTFRKAMLIIGSIGFAAVLIISTGIFPFAIPSEPFWLQYAVLCVPMVMLIAGAAPKNTMARPPVAVRKISSSDITAGITTVILIPLTVLLGTLFIPDSMRKHLLIILAVLAECLAAFFISFEKKKPSAKDIAVLSVLCAAAVAGRELFYMFPQFKPVAAVVIISGTAFGAQAGFLVGALSMLVSNLLFGQGMWTPWQMLAMGLLGFFAGIIFSRRRTTFAICLYSFFSVLILYGGIMNISSVLTYTTDINLQTVAAYIISGIPFDLIHAVSTVIFILIIGDALLKKCCRLRVKFGLFQ